MTPVRVAVVVIVAAAAATAAGAAAAPGRISLERAVLLDENYAPSSPSSPSSGSLPLVRARRAPGGYGPPIWVNTFALTDYHGNFKWGVKHNVGHGGHH